MMRYQDITAHNLVADTAVQVAEEIYETMCSGSNALYKVHGDRKDFIKQCAPTLRAYARTLLATLLSDPNTCEAEKEKIHEALVLDHQLPKSGSSIIKKRSW